jgi:hypothetical protein
MLKKSASFVLASFRGSTYAILRVADLAEAAPGTRRALARRGWAGKKVAIVNLLCAVYS